MGVQVDREEFDDADYARFGVKLSESVVALRELLARPAFGTGPASLGAELELNLVDERGRPCPLNRLALASANDPRLSLEADRFNLEINSRPVAARGAPFAALGADLESALAAAERAAALHGACIVTIGILPTLREEDLVLTDGARYRALSAGLRRARKTEFRVHIEGDDALTLAMGDVVLEGANTSLQLHMRVPPGAFARTYNAAQIATAPVLAVSANSPTFLGRRLWDETRIALFRQSVDDRADATDDDWRAARVSFGHGWVREGVAELFAETIAMHAPLLPIAGDEDPLACVRAGGVPQLDELHLHNSTVWKWNRPVYDAADGGHLRIEMRALPAGPTILDMMANAAFLYGLTAGLAAECDQLLYRICFGQVRRNFYQAARHGMQAELLWPSDEAPSPRLTTIGALLPRLLPIAHRGLTELGVDEAESTRLLDVIAARAERGITGAAWQRAVLGRLGGATPENCERMLHLYAALSAERRPLHEWPEDP
jgi:gamma-glutamyl:cysteine ligase YbdK (ATP-grasp superfamily)